MGMNMNKTTSISDGNKNMTDVEKDKKQLVLIKMMKR